MLKSTNHGNEESTNVDFDFNNVLNKHSVDKRRIFLWGEELDEKDALSIISQLHYLSEKNDEPIQILINSPGGSIDAMCAILDEMKAIQNSGVIISTVACGAAYSAAAFILALGSPGYRYARPNANIMMHPMSYGLGADYSDYQEKLTLFYKKINDRLHRMIMEALQLKGEKQYRKFLTDIDKGLWLTSEQSIERKVIDKIWTKPIGVTYKGK